MEFKIFVDGAEYVPTCGTVAAVAVERWYDRHRREWVLYPVDAEGTQVGEARYGFSKAEANEIEADIKLEYSL